MTKDRRHRFSKLYYVKKEQDAATPIFMEFPMCQSTPAPMKICSFQKRKSPNLPIPRNLFILYVPTSFRDTAVLIAQLIVLLEWRTLPAITSAALQLHSL